jgi:hypothetical protein
MRQPGTYSYQFLVDGTWMTSPDAAVGPDDDGHLCNKVWPLLLPGRTHLAVQALWTVPTPWKG